MTDDQFALLYPKYAASIRAIARKFGNADDALVQDLEQEGRICLWRLDISKAVANPDSYIRNAIRNKIIDFLRKENSGRYDSLDERMEFGEELERLPNGDLHLSAQHTPLPTDFWRDTDELSDPETGDPAGEPLV